MCFKGLDIERVQVQGSRSSAKLPVELSGRIGLFYIYTVQNGSQEPLVTSRK